MMEFLFFWPTVQDPERSPVVSPGGEPLQPAAGGAGGAHEDEETDPGHQREAGAGGLPGYVTPHSLYSLFTSAGLKRARC